MITDNVLQENKRKNLAMTSVNETVAICAGKGAVVHKIGLPKNGVDIFSLWVTDKSGNNKVVIVPNKEWAKFSTLEKEEIELFIEDMLV